MKPAKLITACALLVSVVVSRPAYGEPCTAKIKSGKSPYTHVKENQPIKFWAWELSTTGDDPVLKKRFLGDRMLTIAEQDLYDASPSCASLNKYNEY